MENINAQFGVLDNARDMGLQTIQITHSGNSYPKNLGDWGVIGFNNMEEAESFMDKSGGEVGVFYKMDGWDLWNYKGYTKTAYTYRDYLNKLGDNYCLAYSDNSEYADQLQELAKNIGGDFSDIDKALDEMGRAIEDIRDIIYKVRDADADEVVIIHDLKFYETVKKEFMIFSEDSQTYCIGVFLTKNDIENYEES